MVFADLSVVFLFGLSRSFPKLCDPQRVYGNQTLDFTQQYTRSSHYVIPIATRCEQKYHRYLSAI